MSENKKIKDSELLSNYITFMSENKHAYYDENAYDFGAHIEYNCLDVQNLKHPFFESNQTNNTSTKKNKA